MKQKESLELLHPFNQEKTISQSQFFVEILPIIEQFMNNHEKMTINIAGQSAVGKSTIAEKLSTIIGESASIISIDNYLLGWEVGTLNHDSGILEKPYLAGLNPQVYDLEKFQSDLVKIHNSQEIEMPWFNKITQRRGGVKKFLPSPISIIEGIYALDDEYQKYADLSLLVEAPLHDRLMRKIFRNSTEHAETVDSIITTYLTRDEPAYKYHATRLTTAADLLIQNPIQTQQEFLRTEIKHPKDKNIKKINIKAKAQTGKLQAREALTIILADREIFIQYSVGDNLLLSAPISETSFSLLSQHYELDVSDSD